jgi:hypothetical protein
MKQRIIITILLLSVSVCCAQKKRDRDFIYKPNKVFVFHAKYDSAGTVTENYIVMRILDKKVDNQLAITYDYYDEKPVRETMDSLSSCRLTGFLETTTVLERNKSIWLHPPRSRYHQLAQYFPFPEISFPVRVGKKYTSPYISFNDPLCHCTLGLNFHMQISSYTQYLYQNRLIGAYRINGYANSKHGYFSVLYLFNEELGFVKWVYRKDNILLELNLIEQF